MVGVGAPPPAGVPPQYAGYPPPAGPPAGPPVTQYANSHQSAFEVDGRDRSKAQLIVGIDFVRTVGRSQAV